MHFDLQIKKEANLATADEVDLQFPEIDWHLTLNISILCGTNFSLFSLKTLYFTLNSFRLVSFEII